MFFSKIGIKKYYNHTIIIISLLLIGCYTEDYSVLNRNIAFGDSHISRWDFNFHMKNSSFINYGIRGEKLNQSFLRLKKFLENNVAADIIFLSGNNDVYSCKDQDCFNKVKSDYLKIINELDLLLNDRPKIRLFILSLIPTENCLYIGELNKTLEKELRNSYSVSFVNITKVFQLGIDQCIHSDFTTDNIHLNELAYEKISRLLASSF